MIPSIVEESSEIRVSLEGDLNFSCSQAFKKLMADLGDCRGRSVTFDLSRVSRMDSVGLGLLYIAQEELSNHKGKIRLKSPQPALLKMLELTEAEEDFDIIR